MPIEMSCPSCAARLRVPEEHAGVSARCQKCGATFVIAAPASEEPVLMAEVVATPTAVTAAAPKASLPQRLLDEDDGRGPRRDRPREAASSSRQWLFAACAAFGAFIVVVGTVGGVATFAVFEHLDKRVAEAPRKNVQRDERPPPWGDKKLDQAPIKVKDWPPPPWDDKKTEPIEKRTVFERTVFEEKRVKPKPVPAPKGPVAVAFKDGKFETMVAFNAELQPGKKRAANEYRFTVKADTAYWIVGAAKGRTEMRVTGPDGVVSQSEDRGPIDEIAFLAEKAGTHSLFVECLRFEAMPFQLTIKELDRGEPLPEHLKFTPENKNLPTLKRITGAYGDNKRFVSAAFSPDSKVVWMAHAGALSRWEHLGLGQKGGFEWKWMGQYKTPRQCLFALCVDGQGRLYGQPYKSADERHREWDDIHVFEDLNPVKMDGNIPEPAKEIPFGGIAKRMLLSADGRWIYCLDTYNNRLVRIDIKKGAIDKEVKDISASTGSFCLTPDGKKIYCCSAKNRIDLIDAVEFKLIRSVSLDRGQPVDVAATNEGMVFLAGPPVHPSFEGNAYVVDLTGKPAERAIAMPFVTRAASRTVASASVCLHPNQHAVFVACDRAIIAVDVPARPALFRLHAVERFRAQDASWNRMVLSPDGRTIVHETGSILSVSGELRGK